MKKKLTMALLITGLISLTISAAAQTAVPDIVLSYYDDGVYHSTKSEVGRKAIAKVLASNYYLTPCMSAMNEIAKSLKTDGLIELDRTSINDNFEYPSNFSVDLGVGSHTYQTASGPLVGVAGWDTSFFYKLSLTVKGYPASFEGKLSREIEKKECDKFVREKLMSAFSSIKAAIIRDQKKIESRQRAEQLGQKYQEELEQLNRP